MKNIIQMASILIVVVIIIVGGVLIKMFLVGNVMRPERITIFETEIEETNITIKGKFVQDSSLAFKEFKYRIDANNLYIKVYSTVVSSLYRYGDVNIELAGDELRNISNIYIEDSKTNRLIWEK